MRARRGAAALACLVSVYGQVFRIDTQLVTVPVSVTSRQGPPPQAPLSASDFRVFEDGVEHDVTVVSNTRAPVSLCIVLDLSRSMRAERRGMSLALVEQTIAALHPTDEVSVVVFDRTARELLPWTAATAVPPFAWESMPPDGPTAMIQAVRSALPLMDTASKARRTMLIISDGEENDSAIGVSSLARTRRQSEVLVYGFAITARIDNKERGVDGVGYLRNTVGDSGGYVEPIRVPSDVPTAVKRLAFELSQQMTIGYVPTKAPDGRYRRIKIEMTDKTLRVRHRGGYLATPVTQ